MNTLKTIIKHCVTGIDGETYDPARIYGAIAVFTFLGLSIYSVVFNNSDWNAQDFGIGFGALLVGFGVGVSVKSQTEPEEPPTIITEHDKGGGIGK
jgi:hypothetical protein